ncbi:MAG: CPBP family glutamic-type intramembrane protease [Planctomycetota bacterium]|jgi:hypothetical protein
MIRPAGGIVRRLGAAGFWLLVVAVFLFPYTGLAHRWLHPFDFPAATFTLLVLFGWRWRKSVLARLGIPAGGRAAIAAGGTLVALYLLFRWLVAALAAGGDLLPVSPDPMPSVRWLFQALNEEVLLGFLPLAALHRRFGRPVAAAAGLAALFALLHVGLYRFGGEQVWIRWETGVALLAVGVLRNAVILAAGHVGYAWALHAAWNMAMFNGRWQAGAGGPSLSEPEIFDAFLGDPVMLGITAAAALGALLLLAKKGAASSVTKPPPAALTG